MQVLTLLVWAEIALAAVLGILALRSTLYIWRIWIIDNRQSWLLGGMWRLSAFITAVCFYLGLSVTVRQVLGPQVILSVITVGIVMVLLTVPWMMEREIRRHRHELSRSGSARARRARLRLRSKR